MGIADRGQLSKRGGWRTRGVGALMQHVRVESRSPRAISAWGSRGEGARDSWGLEMGMQRKSGTCSFRGSPIVRKLGGSYVVSLRAVGR